MRPIFKTYLLRIIIVCTIFFNCTSLFSQELLEQKKIFEKGEQLVFSDPDESIKVGIYFLRNKYKPAPLCNLLLAESYNTKGNYSKALEYVFEAGSEVKSDSDSLRISIILLKSKIVGNLGLNGIASNYLDEADKFLKNLKDSDVKEVMYSKLLLEKARITNRLDKHDYNLGLLDGVKNAAVILNAEYFLAQGITYLEKGEYHEAETSLNNSLLQYNKSKIPNTLLKIKIYANLGKLYSLKKEYSKAIDTLKIPLSEAQRIGNYSLIKKIDELIANSYFELGDKKEYNMYNNEMMILWVRLNSSDVEAINLFYKLIEKEKGELYRSQETKHSVILSIMMVLLVVVLLGGVILYFSNRIKERHFKEILNYLEFKNSLTNSKIIKIESLKKVVVPTDTEQTVLEKLKQFELSDEYTNKDMSLAMLASKVDVNTKYLSEIINTCYHDNFNTYINKLRISYIIKKLENDPQYSRYKISYLADECGFSSHTNFTNVFKTITGISPITFIRFLEKEKKTKKKSSIRNFCIVIFCFFAFNAIGQTSKNIDSLLKNLNTYKNPDEAIRIGDSIYNDTKNPVHIRVKGLSLASDGYASKRNYKKALEKILKANELLKNVDDKIIQIKNLTSIALTLQQLKVYDKALEYLDQAKVLIDKYPYKDSITKSIAINYNVKGLIFKDQLNCDIAINYFSKAISEYNKLPNKNYVASQISIIKYNIGNCYLHTSDYELAKKNFAESLKYAEQANANSLKAFALKGMALVYNSQGDHKSSINKLQEAMSISEGVGDVVLNIAIYNALSVNYSSLGDWENHRIYNKKYIEAQEELTNSEREAVSNSVNELIKTENKKLTDLETNFYCKSIALALLIIFSLIILFYYSHKQRKILSALQTTINSAK